MLDLAIPSFIGLPDSPVKKIDPYGEINPEVQNDIASKKTAFELNFNSVIEKATDMVKKVGSKMGAGGISLPEARDRIKDALSGSRQGISYLAEGLEELILGDMTGKDPGTGYVRKANDMIDGVQLVINGKKATFDQEGFPNIQAITDFIGDLADNTLINVFDLGAEAAIVKGILTQVTGWGIPEIIDETYGAKWNERENRYDYDYDDAFRFSVTKRASEEISPSADLKVIKRLMIHGGPTALIANNPDFPTQLLERYNFPLGIVPGAPDPARPTLWTYQEELALLVEILTTLKPDWYQVQRLVEAPGETPAYKPDLIWNLQFISKASEDARTLLCSDTKYVPVVLTSPFYEITSGKQMLKQMYPYIVLQ